MKVSPLSLEDPLYRPRSRKSHQNRYSFNLMLNRPSVWLTLLLLRVDGSVFKAYFREPRLNRAGHCGHNGLCPCFGPGVVRHESPVIFDLDNDPYEDAPLPVGSEK